MEKVKADRVIAEYLQKIYGFAFKKAFSYDEAEELASEIPAGTLGRPEGVANLVKLMLESDDYLTGQVIQYDGGWI